MFKGKELFKKILIFLNAFIIFVYLVFFGYLGYIKPLIRDDIKCVFKIFLIEGGRYVSAFIMLSIDEISKVLNLHLLDFAPYFQCVFYSLVFLFIILVAFYPFFFKQNIFINKNNLSNSIISVKDLFLPFLLFNFYLISAFFIMPDTWPTENVTVYEYIMFVPFYILFLYYQYDLLLKKGEPTNKKILLYSFLAIIFGLSTDFLHLFWILSSFWFLLYSLIKRESPFNAYSLKSFIPLYLFIISLLIYYFSNPKVLDTGLLDREELSYASLYQSLFLVKERIVPFLIDGIYGVILKNKIFISTIFLLLISYLPCFKINFKFKKLIFFHIIGAMTLFFLHILIGNFQNGAQAIIQYGKTTPTFFLWLASFEILLIYGILKDIEFDTKKMKLIKIFIIIAVIVFPYFKFDFQEKINQFQYDISWNKQEKIKEYIRQKLHLHYFLRNEIAIFPISLYYDYETIHEDQYGIEIEDVHKGDEFPCNLFLAKTLDIDDEKILGYKFINDKQAWALYYATGGKEIDTSNIEFTSILGDYEKFKEKNL